MSLVKKQLKAARDALSNKDFISAADTAKNILEYEPDNYNAYVFLGLALLELGHFEESEKAYLQAISLNMDNPLAWQGISKFHERKEAWTKYAESLTRLVELYNNTNETVKCAESWQKLVALHRDKGTRLQLIESLCTLLPGSKLYSLLSNLPAPDSTATTFSIAQSAVYDSLAHILVIIELVEEHENESIEKEIEKRRTRLGAATHNVLTKEVKSEILRSSKLPLLYNEILGHPNTPDDLRRSIEMKLLRHRNTLLNNIPNTPHFLDEKLKTLAEVDEMALGAVLLRIPDELAWTIALEGQDCETVADYDLETLRHFIELFPSSAISSLLKGYIVHMNISFLEYQSAVRLPEDSLDMILNAHAAIPDSVIANLALTEAYLADLDYESTIKAAKSALQALDKFESGSARNLPSTRTGLKSALITSFVHLFPPRHHTRAMNLIDEILPRSPNNVACLTGRAYILEARGAWGDAANLFSRVIELLPEDSANGLRAREEYAWCCCHFQDKDVGSSLLQSVLVTLRGLEGNEPSIARCLWRLGTCYPNINQAYQFYISSLRADPTYAPAFTSLGIYYSEISTPPDPHRALKCFQKAFELDPRETEAARRLADRFAKDNTWDLVEVVSRRAIEGEGNSGSPFDSGSQIQPNISWAWKAIGIVEFNRRNYSQAIHAMQTLLRFDPEDFLSWVRLGEAYIKAGRHAAAIKAFDRASELNPRDWVCSYLIGEVKYQLGNFNEAIDIYNSNLTYQPDELGVLTSLGRAYLDQGRKEISEGFHIRAEQSLTDCISTSLKTIPINSGFRSIAWKILSDAIYALSGISTYRDSIAVREVLRGVENLLSSHTGQFPMYVSPTTLTDGPANGLKVLEVAISAYHYRTSLASSAGSKNGSQWYDLGNALHSWHTKLPLDAASDKIHAEIISCMIRALQEDPENDLYWLGLGNAHFLADPRRAQHAYIRALEIDPKNAMGWTNLGLLYFYHNDTELAIEAFGRAQTLDPDHSVIWLGQALATEHKGDAAEKFEHALGLMPIIPEADLHHASRLFNQCGNLYFDTQAAIDRLLRAFSILDRYCGRISDDATGPHLFALICESLGHSRNAETHLVRAMSILEERYETSEDPVLEQHFIMANLNLARIRLRLHDFHGAVQSFENAIGLLSSTEGAQALSVQAQLGLGIANFVQGNSEVALGILETALQASGANKVLRGHVGVLLSQVIWANHMDGFEEISKAQLLECVSIDPGNLMAIDALTVIGILTDDEGLVDAALSDLLMLRPEQRKEMDPERKVDHLLIQYRLGQQEPQKAKSVAQSSFYSQPSSPEVRMTLAMLLIKERHASHALALLLGLKNDITDVTADLLSLQAAAAGLTGDITTAFHKAQKVVMISPSDSRSWQTLALVRNSAKRV